MKKEGKPKTEICILILFQKNKKKIKINRKRSEKQNKINPYLVNNCRYSFNKKINFFFKIFIGKGKKTSIVTSYIVMQK